MKLEGLKVLVVGLGKSGFSAAKFLAERGAKVTAVDSACEENLKADLKILRKLGVEIFTADNSLKRLESKEMLVVSPGVPVENPLITGAQRVGIPVIGEIELGFRFCNSDIIAITGTNGKSTTCSLINTILKHAEIDSIAAGNIGLPLTSVIPTKKKVIVLEISSYQMETVDTFCPHIAVWLNLTPDHLGRHMNIESYAEVKSRIFHNQTADDYLVYNAGDEILAEYCQNAAAKKIPFSINDDTAALFESKGKIYVNMEGIECELIDVNEITIKGRHNVENALAAAAAALAYGVKVDRVREALKSFTGIEHRQELFIEIDSVKFINDSKATNLNSTLKALETIPAPIILIAGGRGKGESYLPAAELIKEKVKALIALGESAEQLIKELSPFTETLFAHNMEEAVNLAMNYALPGDTVLLSPMCASFDMFNDFEERGRVFKSLVLQLKNAIQTQEK